MSTFPEIINIESVLPHRGRMRLVEQVLTYDADSVAVALQVAADGLFHKGNGVPAYVGIEYMAQAVACWAGAMARLQGRPQPLGFLLGSRRYQAEVPMFACGSHLRIEARRELMGDNGLGVFACRILDEQGQLLASANVSVFEPPDAAAYLEQEA